jgi:hypothetical protein
MTIRKYTIFLGSSPIAAGLLFLLSTPCLLLSQVVPGVRDGPTLNVFGTYTRASPEATSGYTFGFSAGGFVQTHHLLGIETRGTYLHWGAGESRYDALAGPRASFRIWRLTPYIAALGGIGHMTNTNAEWKGLGGMDLYVHHRLSFRLGEISSAKLYAVPHAKTYVDYSAGLVYRFSGSSP